MWLVQSVVDPPSMVYNMKHGQVMISRCDSAKAGMAEFGSVIGPPSTVILCSASGTDPWLQQDPWQQALAQTQAVPKQNVPAQLQEMEHRLEKSIMDRLPLERMETDENDARIQALEQQMQQMATKHQHLENVVTEHHRQNAAQVQNLQAQMMSQMEVQRTHMASMFDDQMSKLETILAKKGLFE